jgi:L-asparaginase
MKKTGRIWVFFLIFVFCRQDAFSQGPKPNIVILATGGTIAGAAATGTQSSYTSGAVTIDAMLAAVPGIKDLANIKGEQISNVGSQDMTFDIMLHLAKPINELLPTNAVDGIRHHARDRHHGGDRVFPQLGSEERQARGHGRIHAALHGCQRRRAADLYDAVAVAGDPKAKGRGVLVVMNDWIHGAHSLTKTSTTATQTFMSPLRGLVGVAAYGKNDYYNNPQWKHTTASEFDVSNVTRLPRVDVIFADADMSPDLIDCSVKNGAKGIVIAGVGNGNMNKASLEAAARAAKQGVVVVRSSRVPTGTVGRNVEVNDDELGLVASDELNPQKSRILLALALLKSRPLSQIQELFYTYRFTKRV